MDYGPLLVLDVLSEDPDWASYVYSAFRLFISISHLFTILGLGPRLVSGWALIAQLIGFICETYHVKDRPRVVILSFCLVVWTIFLTFLLFYHIRSY